MFGRKHELTGEQVDIALESLMAIYFFGTPQVQRFGTTVWENRFSKTHHELTQTYYDNYEKFESDGPLDVELSWRQWASVKQALGFYAYHNFVGKKADVRTPEKIAQAIELRNALIFHEI